MSRPALRGDRRGLTLIELLLALTILALSGALVSGALATGLRAWQTGLHGGREDLVARVVLERIAAQLRAAVPAPARREGSEVVAFDAAESRLRLVTLAAAGAAPVQVSYGLEDTGGGERLVYREYPWPDKDFFSESISRREEIVAEVTGFAVTAFGRSEPDDPDDPDGAGDAGAPREWSPQDGELPASVVVEIALGGSGSEEPRRVSVTVPIPTQRKGR